MKKMINAEHFEGRIYQHELNLKTVQNKQSENFGKEFIGGKLHLAVDEEGMNVVPIHYSYVTEFNKSGKPNETFKLLKGIIDGTYKTWIENGKDEATKMLLTPALDLNDFYIVDTEESIAAKRNEGGFANLVNELNEHEEQRNTFSVDMFITQTTRVEENPEKEIPEHVKVRGAIFNFRGDILPVEFTVTEPTGMDFFENLEVSPSEPMLRKVWGRVNSINKEVTIEEESAFGTPEVKTAKRTIKEWVITGTAKEPYDFGDENVLTVEEVQKAMQDREVHLADVKRRAIEYQESKNNNFGAPTANASASTAAQAAAASSVKAGEFKF